MSRIHFTITKTLKKPHNTTNSRHSSSWQKHHEWKEGQRSRRWWRVTLHVHTCSGRNRITSLMRRPNTGSAPNNPLRYRVTNFWYVTWSRIPSTLSRYGVTVRGNVTSVYPTLEVPRFAIIHLWENGIHPFVIAMLYLVSCPMRPLGSAKNVRVQMSLSKIYDTL